MELFIRIVDGQPVDHPILEENFRAAFPEIDINNLPPEFARFIRVPQPRLGPYEKNVTATYEWVDGVVTDVWHVEQMTAEERQEKIAQMMNFRPFPSWVFDEVTCRWDAPIPYPTDGNRYRWDEPTTSWVEVILTE